MYHLTRLWLILAAVIGVAGFTAGWLAARSYYRWRTP
jgi:hypothetical protein